MRSLKGSRRIVIQDVEYRWRAKGDDGYISVGIWPANNIGSYIRHLFPYDQTWIRNIDGSASSLGDQIVITNRLIKRIIEAAIAGGYNPNMNQGKEFRCKSEIKWNDAIRASDLHTTSKPLAQHFPTGEYFKW